MPTKKEKIAALPIRVSTGNSKLGKHVFNLNLPPIQSCVKNIPCAKECYAMKAWTQYPNVRDAWGMNLETYQRAPDEYFRALYEYIKLHPKMELFRFHSAGDMPDAYYWLGVKQIAEAFPGIKFMIFTKRYDFIYTRIPKNLNVIISTWLGHPLPMQEEQNSAYNLQWAWISEDPRAPEQHMFKCPGKCDECGYECWQSGDRDIVFDLH